MNKAFKCSTGNVQKIMFNSADQQVRDISSNLVIYYMHQYLMLEELLAIAFIFK